MTCWVFYTFLGAAIWGFGIALFLALCHSGKGN